MEEKEKRKWLEYLKKLQDKVLAEDAILMAGTKNSQIVGAKYKEVVNIFLEDKMELQPSKKTKEKQLRKYYGNTVIKMGGDNLCERCMCAR